MQTILKYRLIVIFIVALCLAAVSWQSDDAYHAYVMARNLVEGNGFVYAVGERVNASTCPLWTLICAGVYAFSGNMYASTLILGILVSTAAFGFIAYRCKEQRTLLFCAVLFVFSPCFVFGVSGLENCLLMLLSGLLLYFILSPSQPRQRRNLFAIALLMSLLAWTRMDAVLLFAPACVYVYLKQRDQNVSFLSSVAVALLGLSPFLLWLLFSTWYYGFPFPNTAYAKLGALLPRSYYLTFGSKYMFWSFFCYISIPVAIILAFYLSFRKNRGSNIPIYLCAGVIIHLMYIVNVGGDFMVGRHYSTALYLCMYLIARQIEVSTPPVSVSWKLTCSVLVWSLVSITLLPLSFFFESGTLPKFLGIGSTPQCSFLQSRYFSMEITAWGMFASSSLLHPDRFEIGILSNQFGNPDNFVILDGMRQLPYPLPSATRVDSASGFLVYQVGTASRLVDSYGLGDALIARLPSATDFPRIGHVYRIIPEGYVESLQSGENQIVDPKIHEYYDHLKIIISGDLFSMERLKEIYRFNTGQYSYLLRP